MVSTSRDFALGRIACLLATIALAFDGVTLRHLITMSSGLRFNESDDPNSDMGMADGGQVIAGRPPIRLSAMR